MAEPSSQQLQTLALMRLDDARALLSANQFSGAYYLAGDAVECGLKSIIARSFRETVIPDRALVQRVHTHNLVELVGLANLRPALDRRIRSSDSFRASWFVASDWNEASRYEIILSPMAELIVDAVGSEPDGILQWLREHW
ncbi:MAG: hypothetical protein ACK4VM_20350 [Bosea sp. (in: a-proteobacteria)]